MATDFRFSLENQPGTGARALAALAQAGINAIAACGVSGGQTVHVTVEDADAERARQAMEGAGVTVSEECQVLVQPIEDRPGAGAELMQRIAGAGVNLNFLFLATHNRVVIGVDDPQKAQQALQ